MPVEPPPTPWQLEAHLTEPGEDLVGVGADLEPGTILAAYRLGLFPMGVGANGRPPVGWWSPDPRGVLPLDGLRVSRSLRHTGQAESIASPWYLAARERYGLASQTSNRPVRPAYTSARTARRCSE